MRMIRVLCILMSAPFFLMAQPELSLEAYVNGLNRPVDIVSAGDDRLFIVEQGGRIKIIDGDGTLLAMPFLQLTVNFGQNEQGLLGMAFHPDYANNGYFYIDYTSGSGNGFSKISRFSVDSNDPNQADSNSEVEILTVTQPEWNHNAGDLNFGPDGYLYIGFGDGGSGGDPWGNGQNTQVMLGKMLRIDIDNGTPYSIPADNPFVDDSDVLDEIWAVGMRNPWRYSFDKITGDLWIGDVGQNDEEEIDFEPAGSGGGFNYGWDCKEGVLDFQPNNCAADVEFVSPVASYKVSNFCNSVTGGYVYRACEFPDLVGHYIYADYCNGFIWSVRPNGSGGWINTEIFHNNGFDISTFGEDAQGNLYAARLGNGTIYKLTTSFNLDDISYDEPNDVITAPDGYESYQWYQNSLVLNGATNATLSNVNAMGAATYYCELTYNLGNCTMNTNEVSVVTVGINHIPGLSYFNVLPNPFSDKVMLELATEKELSLSIEILNVNGEVLLTLPQKTATVFRKELNLSHLSSGVYFLRIQSKTEKMTMKLLKY